MTLPFNFERKVIVSAGVGGVGKTTLSACLGIIAAQQGRRVLVLTIDPARRLAEALGISPDIRHEVKVELKNTTGTLTALMIDQKSIFDRFVENSASTPERAQRILENRLYKQISTTLSGSQEFTSLEKLSVCLESNLYDLIILDTPPAEHAIDFLYAPKKIHALFQNSVSQWFMKKPESIGIWQSFLNQGTKTALSYLEKITGAHFISELSEFFSSMGEIQKEICDKSLSIHRLLTSTDCAFLLIIGFNQSHFRSSIDFINELKKGDYQFDSLIVNRCYPEWDSTGHSSNNPKQYSLDGSSNLSLQLIPFHTDFSYYTQNQNQNLNTFQKQFASSTPLFKIPDLKVDESGLQGIQMLAEKIKSYLNLPGIKTSHENK